MDASTAWSAESREALAAVAASVAALAALAFPGGDCTDPPGADSLPEVDPLAGLDPAQAADPLRDLADACLDGLAELARTEARSAALKVHLTAEYARAATALAPPAASPQEHTAQEMAIIAEVACVLTVSERTAAALLFDSQTLTTALPLTLDALQAGSISFQHARIIVDETTNLDPAGAAALEAHFLDPAAANPARGCPAGDLTPGRFRARARAWRERHHPVSIETRHTKGAADRRVEYHPDRDGMAWLSAYLPADTAAGIWDRTTTAARTLQGPHETRTLPQLRADITATWLLTTSTDGDVGGGMSGQVPSPRAQVLITVPVLSLLGATDEPATLDGYGPIPPSMARRLITNGSGSFYRVLVDPRDGAPLEIGRASYRLTKPQRNWLRLRDAKCPFPGCNNNSLDNDADHLLAWANGGTTGITNLGQPCPKHHRLKHTTAWTPTGATKTNPPGWTSPTGRHYPSEQQDWEPPHWPPDTPPTAIRFDSCALRDQGPDTGPEQFSYEMPEPDPDQFPDESPDQDFEPAPPPDQGPESEQPADPFPDWYSFTAGHPLPSHDTASRDTADECWQAPRPQLGKRTARSGRVQVKPTGLAAGRSVLTRSSP